jgi:hypothetical protein
MDTASEKFYNSKDTIIGLTHVYAYLGNKYKWPRNTQGPDGAVLTRNN